MRGVMVDITEAKQAQQALQRSEATNRALIEAMPDLLLRISKDGVYLDYKAARFESPYAEPATLVGRTLEDALPPEVAAEARSLLKRSIETGSAQMHECRLPVKGSPHDFEARLAPIGQDEALVLVRDITQRKRAEESLRAAEAELRRVLVSVSDGIWSAELGPNERGKFVYHSRAVERICGRPPEYYSATERWLDQVHPDDLERVKAAFKRMAAGRSAREQMEFRVVWPDRTLHWVRTTVNASPLDGGRIRLDGVDSDITAHKLANEALRQANEALRTVIQASPLAIFEFDLEGRVKSWNPAAEQIFGWSKEEALGRPLPWITEERELKAFRDRGGVMSAVEATEKRKDGSTVELSLWSAPLRDAAGAPSGFIMLAAEMTERRQLEAQLRQSQKMEAVGRLAGGVAHDFNNLLTVITGCAHMLLQDLSGSDPLRINAEEILRAVDRASALTNQLLAFSRRQVARPRPADLSALVANMDRMLRRVIGEDVELATDLSPTLAKVKADPMQIEQVIMNLVVNSRDAMPAGGKITIRTADVQLDREFARLHPTARPGAYVLLSVSDNGNGMDDEIKAHLFEPFFTTKEQGKGTGLGLSMVYGIVRQCGGEIAVASEPGQGATVSIYLPRMEGAADETTASIAPAVIQSGRETILLVEDEDEVRRLVRDVLSRQGYTVIEASDPDGALRLSEEFQRPIDLLLSDVVMPQMSGPELARRLAPRRPKMKVLFMSGYTDDPALGEGGRNPLLRKPFAPQDLAHRLRQTLDGPAQAESAAAVDE